MPCRGAHILSHFKSADQQEFADSIATQATLTTNELLKAGEWLYDLLKPSGAGLQAFLREKKLNEILQNPDWDRRQKAERFFKALRTLRFPRLTDYEKKFESAASEVGGKDLKLEMLTSFEEEGFWVRAKMRDKKSVQNILNLLEDKKTLLNSLFDLML